MSGTVGLSRMHLIVDPWTEAARTLEAGRRDHPRFADWRHLLGLLYLAQAKPAEALAEFDAALEVNPQFHRARFARLVARRRLEGALDPAEWNQEGAGAGVDEPERSLWTAWFLAQSGDREGTRQALTILAGRPGWAGPAWYARAVYEAAWGDVEQARQSLAAAAIAHPLYRRILEERGAIPQGKQGRRATWDAGGVLGDAGLESWNPAASELCHMLGELLVRAGQTDQARPFFEEGFLREGKESVHQIRLSQIALAHGEEEEAVAALCRAIEVDPTSATARVALGFEYQSQGFHDEAVVQFEVAARLRPEWPDVQYNLGLLYGAQGRGDDAARCLRRALDTNPQYFQARMSLAQVLQQRGAWEDALTELEQLEGQGIQAADLHVQKAQCLLTLDRVPEAVQALEAAAGVNPSYARTYYILGQAYRRLGLRRKARHAWQQYLDRSRSWGDQKPVGGLEEVLS